ncbi:unnamed protein product [Caenorhabditis auriculariae]|uniref:Ig-like domain-containing protein n=1 Tax=Caenorhabditis auriculariae TaxID=2777116 RepID=A0A8S1GSP2_9PELO|nr:unnamed protein product [Caenorhabditis auriculariae]
MKKGSKKSLTRSLKIKDDGELVEVEKNEEDVELNSEYHREDETAGKSHNLTEKKKEQESDQLTEATRNAKFLKRQKTGEDAEKSLREEPKLTENYSYEERRRRVRFEHPAEEGAASALSKDAGKAETSLSLTQAPQKLKKTEETKDAFSTIKSKDDLQKEQTSFEEKSMNSSRKAPIDDSETKFTYPSKEHEANSLSAVKSKHAFSHKEDEGRTEKNLGENTERSSFEERKKTAKKKKEEDNAETSHQATIGNDDRNSLSISSKNIRMRKKQPSESTEAIGNDKQKTETSYAEVHKSKAPKREETSEKTDAMIDLKQKDDASLALNNKNVKLQKPEEEDKTTEKISTKPSLREESKLEDKSAAWKMEKDSQKKTAEKSVSELQKVKDALATICVSQSLQPEHTAQSEESTEKTIAEPNNDKDALAMTGLRKQLKTVVKSENSTEKFLTQPRNVKDALATTNLTKSIEAENPVGTKGFLEKTIADLSKEKDALATTALHPSLKSKKPTEVSTEASRNKNEPVERNSLSLTTVNSQKSKPSSDGSASYDIKPVTPKATDQISLVDFEHSITLEPAADSNKQREERVNATTEKSLAEPHSGKDFLAAIGLNKSLKSDNLNNMEGSIQKSFAEPQNENDSLAMTSLHTSLSPPEVAKADVDVNQKEKKTTEETSLNLTSINSKKTKPTTEVNASRDVKPAKSKEGEKEELSITATAPSLIAEPSDQSSESSLPIRRTQEETKFTEKNSVFEKERPAQTDGAYNLLPVQNKERESISLMGVEQVLSKHPVDSRVEDVRKAEVGGATSYVETHKADSLSSEENSAAADAKIPTSRKDADGLAIVAENKQYEKSDTAERASTTVKEKRLKKAKSKLEEKSIRSIQKRDQVADQTENTLPEQSGAKDSLSLISVDPILLPEKAYEEVHQSSAQETDKTKYSEKNVQNELNKKVENDAADFEKLLKSNDKNIFAETNNKGDLKKKSPRAQATTTQKEKIAKENSSLVSKEKLVELSRDEEMAGAEGKLVDQDVTAETLSTTNAENDFKKAGLVDETAGLVVEKGAEREASSLAQTSKTAKHRRRSSKAEANKTIAVTPKDVDRLEALQKDAQFKKDNETRNSEGDVIPTQKEDTALSVCDQDNELNKETTQLQAEKILKVKKIELDSLAELNAKSQLSKKPSVAETVGPVPSEREVTSTSLEDKLVDVEKNAADVDEETSKTLLEKDKQQKTLSVKNEAKKEATADTTLEINREKKPPKKEHAKTKLSTDDKSADSLTVRVKDLKLQNEEPSQEEAETLRKASKQKAFSEEKAPLSDTHKDLHAINKTQEDTAEKVAPEKSQEKAAVAIADSDPTLSRGEQSSRTSMTSPAVFVEITAYGVIDTNAVAKAKEATGFAEFDLSPASYNQEELSVMDADHSLTDETKKKAEAAEIPTLSADKMTFSVGHANLNLKKEDEKGQKTASKDHPEKSRVDYSESQNDFEIGKESKQNDAVETSDQKAKEKQSLAVQEIDANVEADGKKESATAAREQKVQDRLKASVPETKQERDKLVKDSTQGNLQQARYPTLLIHENLDKNEETDFEDEEEEEGEADGIQNDNVENGAQKKGKKKFIISAISMDGEFSDAESIAFAEDGARVERRRKKKSVRIDPVTQVQNEKMPTSEKRPTETVVEEGAAPSFKKKMQYIGCIEGDNVKIEFKINSNPSPKIGVSRNDKAVNDKHKMHIARRSDGNVHTFQVTIDGVAKTDGGKLVFEATNKFGNDKCTVLLDVRDASSFVQDPAEEYQAAGLVDTVSDVCVKEGDTAKLTGKVSGFPLPELIWIKNGREVDMMAPSTKYHLEYHSDGEFEARIANCGFEDDDDYSLLVENLAGVDSCNFQVYVDCKEYPQDDHFNRRRRLQRGKAIGEASSDSEIEGKNKKRKRRMKKVFERTNPNAPRLTQLIPPRFDKILSDHDAVVGENVVMMVETLGEPEPQVWFYQDGKLIDETNEKVEIRHEEEKRKHWLILKDIRKDEEAEYACQAINVVGEAWCFSDVFVHSSIPGPVFVRQPIQIQEKPIDEAEEDKKDNKVKKKKAKEEAEKEIVVQQQEEVTFEEEKKNEKDDKIKKTKKKRDESVKPEKKEGVLEKTAQDTEIEEQQVQKKKEEVEQAAQDEEKKGKTDSEVAEQDVTAITQQEETKKSQELEQASQEKKKKEQTKKDVGKRKDSNAKVVAQEEESKETKLSAERTGEELKKKSDKKEETETTIAKIQDAQKAENDSAEETKRQDEKLMKDSAKPVEDKKAEEKQQAVPKVDSKEKKTAADKKTVVEIGEAKKEAEEKAEKTKPTSDETTKDKEKVEDEKKESVAAKKKTAEVGKEKTLDQKKKEVDDKKGRDEKPIEGKEEKAKPKSKLETVPQPKLDTKDKKKEEKAKRSEPKSKQEKKPGEHAEARRPSIKVEVQPEVGKEEEKKKKNIPKPLFIPDEISSRFGDPSTIHSETNITTQITAREGSAEIMSPLTQPQSASVVMKVESANKTKDSAEFSFKRRSETPEGKNKRKEGLPPRAEDKKTEEGVGVEPKKKTSKAEPAGQHEIKKEESTAEAHISLLTAAKTDSAAVATEISTTVQLPQLTESKDSKKIELEKPEKKEEVKAEVKPKKKVAKLETSQESASRKTSTTEAESVKTNEETLQKEDIEKKTTTKRRSSSSSKQALEKKPSVTSKTSDPTEPKKPGQETPKAIENIADSALKVEADQKAAEKNLRQTQVDKKDTTKKPTQEQHDDKKKTVKKDEEPKERTKLTKERSVEVTSVREDGTPIETAVDGKKETITTETSLKADFSTEVTDAKNAKEGKSAKDETTPILPREDTEAGRDIKLSETKEKSAEKIEVEQDYKKETVEEVQRNEKSAENKAKKVAEKETPEPSEKEAIKEKTMTKRRSSKSRPEKEKAVEPSAVQKVSKSESEERDMVVDDAVSKNSEARKAKETTKGSSAEEKTPSKQQVETVEARKPTESAEMKPKVPEKKAETKTKKDSKSKANEEAKPNEASVAKNFEDAKINEEEPEKTSEEKPPTKPKEQVVSEEKASKTVDGVDTKKMKSEGEKAMKDDAKLQVKKLQAESKPEAKKKEVVEPPEKQTITGKKTTEQEAEMQKLEKVEQVLEKPAVTIKKKILKEVLEAETEQKSALVAKKENLTEKLTSREAEKEEPNKKKTETEKKAAEKLRLTEVEKKEAVNKPKDEQPADKKKTTVKKDAEPEKETNGTTEKPTDVSSIKEGVSLGKTVVDEKKEVVSVKTALKKEPSKDVPEVKKAKEVITDKSAEDKTAAKLQKEKAEVEKDAKLSEPEGKSEKKADKLKAKKDTQPESVEEDQPKGKSIEKKAEKVETEKDTKPAKPEEKTAKKVDKVDGKQKVDHPEDAETKSKTSRAKEEAPSTKPTVEIQASLQSEEKTVPPEKLEKEKTINEVSRPEEKEKTDAEKKSKSKKKSSKAAETKKITIEETSEGTLSLSEKKPALEEQESALNVDGTSATVKLPTDKSAPEVQDSSLNVDGTSATVKLLGKEEIEPEGVEKPAEKVGPADTSKADTTENAHEIKEQKEEKKTKKRVVKKPNKGKTAEEDDSATASVQEKEEKPESAEIPQFSKEPKSVAEEKIFSDASLRNRSTNGAEDASFYDSSRKTSLASSDEGRRRRRRRTGFASTFTAETLALRGDNVEFEVELYNEEDEVRWEVDSKDASKNARCHFTESSFFRTLILDNVSPDDTGLVVTAFSDGQSVSTKLAVEELPTTFVNYLPRKSSGKEGQELTISVTFNHPVDVNSVFWFKDGKKLADSTEYSIDTVGCSCSLTIRRANYADSGKYEVQCEGARCGTYITVQGKPVISGDGAKQVVQVDKDEKIKVHIPYDSEPEASFSLLKEGKEAEFDMRSQVDVVDDGIVYSKRNATKDDAGEYTVSLKNEFGEATQKFVVKVNDSPPAPSDISVTQIESDALTVEWNPPSDNNGAAITSYVIEKKEEGRRKFHKVATVSGAKTSYIVDELEMASSYIIRVAAVNKFGTGDFVETKPVTTGSPFGAPVISSAPEIEPHSANTCNLSWATPETDGGSPIYGYDVFQKEDNGDWHKLNTDDLVFVEKYHVKGLNSGVDYQFKVEAINEAGIRSSSNVPSETYSIHGNPPEVVLEVPSVKVLDSDKVQVTWNAEGNDDFVIQYKSDGSSIWANVESATAECVIDGLREGISYVFRVAARNVFGTGEYSDESVPMKILADDAPRIIKAIKSTTIPKKRSLRLECHATGHPTPEYIWFKDGEEVIPSDENTEIVNEGFMSALIIHVVSDAHAGEYKVLVENDHGSSESTATVSLSDVRAHFNSSFGELTETEEGRDIELTCEVSDEEAVVNWYKDGKKLVPSDRVQFFAVARKRTIRIKNTTSADSGTYKCETSDGRSRTEGEVVVKEEESRITVGPQDKVISAFGETVELTCELTKPVRKVAWYKNGQEVWPQMNKTAMSVEGTKAVLEIKNFNTHDIGEYVAALSENEKSAAANLSLEVLPEVELPEDFEGDVVCHAGKELDFQINFTGFPPPKVHITSNGTPIRALGDVEEYDDSVSVRMKNLKRSDSGPLRITAENAKGFVTREVNLDVIDVPSEPLALRVSDVTEDSALISWEAPEETNGAPITGYVVERKGVDNNRWRPVGHLKSTQFTFSADELFSNQVYGFRVLAVNEVGESEPSETVDAMTKEESEPRSESSDVFVPRIAQLETPSKPRLTVEGTKVHLEWDWIPETSLYKLERKQEGEDDWMELANTDRNSFSDRSIVESGIYVYQVTATGIHAISDPSPTSDSATIQVDEKLSKKSKKPEENISKDEADVVQVNGGDAVSAKSDEIQEINIERQDAKTEEVTEIKEEQKAISEEKAPDATEKQPLVEKKEKVLKKKETASVEKDKAEAEGELKEVKEKLKKGKTVEKTASQASEQEKEEISSVKKSEENEKQTEDVAEEALVKAEETHVEMKSGAYGEIKATIASTDVDVEWKKNGKKLDASISVETKGTTTTLRIPSVDDKSSGEYTCRVKSREGKEASVSIIVSVKDVPRVEAESAVVEVKEGETARLAARVAGSPKPACHWTKDEKPIKEDKNVKSSVKEGVAELTISKVEAAHAGTYRLSASNTSGENNVEIALKIKGTPSAPVGPLVITDITNTSVNLAWKASENDGGSQILGYCIEKKESSKRSWSFVQRTTKEQFTLEGLAQKTSYDIRVMAENAYGTGAAIEGQATTTEVKEKPTQAPGKPAITATTAKTVSLEWKGVDQEEITYTVQMKEANSKRAWSTAAKDIQETSTTVVDLKEGSDYVFRVMATNGAGQGPASEQSDVAKCQQPVETSKPKFVVTPEDIISVKGSKTKISAEFSGQPAPEIHWFKNKKEIFSGQRQWIETVGNATSLTIGELREDDEGEYKIALKNSQGSVEHSLKLTMDQLPEINRVERYSSTLVFDKGETVKLRLSFSGTLFKERFYFF